MPLLSKTFLRKVAKEGVSQNGSMGLGGDAEGFEIANQGVTRRRPGEGPKANGGRSQLQTMDSYDQPQYKNEEAPWFGAGDPEGWDRQIATGLTNPGRDVTDEKVDPEEVKSSEKDWEEQIPGGLAKGKRPEEFDIKKLAQGVEVEMEHTTDMHIAIEIAMDHIEEDPEYYDKLDKMENEAVGDEYDFTQDNPKIAGAMDADYRMKKGQIPTLSHTKGYDFTKDNEKLIQMLGIAPEGEESYDVDLKDMFGEGNAVEDMKSAVKQMSNKFDPSGMKDVQHRMKKAAKDFGNTKPETKMGEQLKRTIIVKEVRGEPLNLQPGDRFCAVQYLHLDNVDANDPKLSSAGYKFNPAEACPKGYVVYEVQPDGKLMTKAANFDSGD